MLTVSYSLTPEDLAELEAEAEGGWFRRILHIPVRAFLGAAGLILIWQAFFFFPSEHWFGNLAIAGFGAFLLWMTLDWPGLRKLSRRLFDPTAVQQVSFLDGKVVYSSRGATQQFQWFPERGFKENEKFFLLQTPEARKLAIPKRAFSPDQEHAFRELLHHEPARGESIDCRFTLTRDELNEATVARHPWIGSKTGKVVMRALSGSCASLVLWFPLHVATSWSQIFRNEPGVAIGLIVYAAFCLWSATGYVGLRDLNRLDLERQIRISNLDVKVTLGTRTKIYKWREFFLFQETPNLLVLWTPFTRFWTIPKRSLQPEDQEKLRALLDRKLRERSSSRI